MQTQEVIKTATQFSEIATTVDLNLVIDPTHPFFVDFSEVRGDFKEMSFYKSLNVNPNGFILDDANIANPKLIFFAGHRGSGKSTEISKFVEKMNKKDCFYCVVCNLDTGLDINNIDFVDISIYMLECLVQQLHEDKIHIKDSDIKSFYDWYSERITEINEKTSASASIEAGAGAKISLFDIFNVFVKTRASLSGTDETKNTIRTVFTNRFTDFALKFSEFIANINIELSKKGIAKNLLFVVDGIEKAYSIDITRKIILDESNRLRHLKTNMLFTLPFGLMEQRARLELFSKVISFPMVKLQEKDGKKCDGAFEKFREFIYKRVNGSLFDSERTVDEIIRYGGGSPRETLRIIETARIFSEDSIINAESLKEAIKELAKAGNYLKKPELDKLKEIAECNKNKRDVPYDDIVDELMQKNIVFEYNTGSYKRVNPVIEASPIYQQYVANKI